MWNDYLTAKTIKFNTTYFKELISDFLTESIMLIQKSQSPIRSF